MIDKKLLQQEALRQNQLESVALTPEQINQMLAENSAMSDEEKTAMVTQMFENERKKKLAQLIGE